MNKKLSSLFLLAVLSITDAYLLAHPNLIGRLGVLLYKHVYIRNFPRALLTVLLVVGLSLLTCELLFRVFKNRLISVFYLFFFLVSLGWLAYVYITFSTFSYRITGKAFIYGAHLLPIIMTGLFGRYFVKTSFMKNKIEKHPSDTLSD